MKSMKLKFVSVTIVNVLSFAKGAQIIFKTEKYEKKRKQKK